MNVQKFIAAAVVFVAAGSAFAANPADTTATAAAPAAASASAAVLASNQNLPTVTINSAGRSRAEVRAEAVEFVKHYQTALSVQLDQYKN
jgi:hypothetical protein